MTFATAGAPSGRRPSRSFPHMRHTLIIAAMLLVAGCANRDVPGIDSLAARRDSIRADSVARARQDSINRATPGYVIDSLLPPEEEARRFRAAFPATARPRSSAEKGAARHSSDASSAPSLPPTRTTCARWS